MSYQNSLAILIYPLNNKVFLPVGLPLTDVLGVILYEQFDSDVCENPSCF